MFREIDDFIVDRVSQPVADRVAHRMRAPILAQTVLVGSAALECCSTYLFWLNGNLPWLQTIILAAGLALTMSWAWSAESTKTPEGLMPRWRTEHLVIRSGLCIIVFAYFLLYLAIFAFGTLTMASAASELACIVNLGGLYFMACRTNPPKRKEATKEKFAFASN